MLKPVAPQSSLLVLPVFKRFSPFFPFCSQESRNLPFAGFSSLLSFSFQWDISVCFLSASRPLKDNGGF